MLLNSPQRVVLACLAGLVVLANTSAPATATSGEDLAGQKRVAQKVFGSNNPSATLKSLSAKERDLFKLSQRYLDSKIVQSRGGPLTRHLATPGRPR
jgi:hypothetical protein